MANYPPPYPPPQPPYGDWRYQRRVMREQARVQREVLRAQRDAYRYQMRGSRRSSILGPLLLISIGVIFLLVQLGKISAHSFWDWYGHWWPLLLVCAGIIMLLEWAFDQYFHNPDEPYRRRSVGGGVFTLLLLAVIAGVFVTGIREGHNFFGSMHLDPDNMDEFLGDKHEIDQTLVQTLPAGGSVAIDNPRGDVTISGTSDDNQVHIDVHKQVYTRTDADADTRAMQLSPAVENAGGSLNVKVPFIQGARADLTVTVPPQTPIRVNANHGEIHVASLRAPVQVTANHGDTDVTAINGPVEAHINNSDSSFSAHSIHGNVTLTGKVRDLTLSDIAGDTSSDGDFFGTTHIEHITGFSRFHTSRTDFRLARLDGEVNINNDDLRADQVLGPLTLATRNKNVTLDRVAGTVSVTNSNGDVDVTVAPPLGNVTVENRHGSVNVTLPEKAAFTVQAETTNGDAENDFSLSSNESDNNNRKTISGTVGQGGPLIKINTSQGDIAIKKASVAPLPPKPPAPPPLTLRNNDGSQVVIGKNGVNISGADGSVVIDKGGISIRKNADGSSSYSSGGTKLVDNVDGSRVFTKADGSTYTRGADGSKVYVGRDGTRITLGADGSRLATGPNGRTLSDSEIDNRLNQAERDADRVAAERDRQAAAMHNR